jgi:hypothetical protein
MLLGYLSSNFHITSAFSFNKIYDIGLVLKRAFIHDGE